MPLSPKLYRYGAIIYSSVSYTAEFCILSHRTAQSTHCALYLWPPKWHHIYIYLIQYWFTSLKFQFPLNTMFKTNYIFLLRILHVCSLSRGTAGMSAVLWRSIMSTAGSRVWWEVCWGQIFGQLLAAGSPWYLGRGSPVRFETPAG